MGRELGVRYPLSALEELGIHPQLPACERGTVSLADLRPEFLASLEAALSIPMDRRITFVDMERIYRLRRPLTKHSALFVPMLEKIARDYATMGVRYVELSLADIVEADRLRAVHREMPRIEKESGVTIRFLAAFGRHDDWDWDLDLIDRLCTLAQSSYIVGADFMGHETNSTRDFARQIREIATRMGKLRPGFTVRVHAGENPAHPENVRTAIEAVDGCDVQLRIGHGLYGVDDATLNLLCSTGTIVEFNLNSNLALNNIQSPAEVPIARYLDRGVAVVLGTDGYGIYQTGLEMEARAAMLCGVKPEQLEAVARTEARYVKARLERDRASTIPSDQFLTPDDVPNVHYQPAEVARKEEAIRLRDQTLLERVRAIGAELLDRDGVSRLMAGKRCISIAGAWNKSWNALSDRERESIHAVLEGMVQSLSPAETVLVTGGTRLGVEGLVQRLAITRGFTVLATIVNETPPDFLEPGSITHTHIVGQSLYSKAAGLYTLVKECRGVCVFIGGGSIVNDEIQTTFNLRLRYLLMDGPTGASTLRARQQPELAFTTADQLLAKLAEAQRWRGTAEPYWHTGANPTVDVVAFRIAPDRGVRQVLLIRRHTDSPTEGGKWAFPGGFQHTHAPRGMPWQADSESATQAALRELGEETGLDLSSLEAQLIPVGIYEHGGRDPRDTAESWSRSQVFMIDLPPEPASKTLCGADDASDARWFNLDQVPVDLAFDHRKILDDALRGQRTDHSLAS
jgi:ADP-ribose pyrophosphatase YjhB (NUDIX family)